MKTKTPSPMTTQTSIDSPNNISPPRATRKSSTTKDAKGQEEKTASRASCLFIKSEPLTVLSDWPCPLSAKNHAHDANFQCHQFISASVLISQAHWILEIRPLLQPFPTTDVRRRFLVHNE